MFGNTRQGGGGKDAFVRLTGLFQTKKGNWIGRVQVQQFDTLVKLMKDAHSRNGTLNFVIAPDKSGKPAMSVVVGDEYKPQNQGNQSGGMFAQAAAAPPQQFSPAPATTAPPAREVTFGQADVPKDSFDKLLEDL
jgi:hypothetical protein